MSVRKRDDDGVAAAACLASHAPMRTRALLLVIALVGCKTEREKRIAAVADAATLTDAVKLAAPTDSDTDFSPGTGAIAHWAARKAKWIDFSGSAKGLAIRETIADSKATRGSVGCDQIIVSQVKRFPLGDGFDGYWIIGGTLPKGDEKLVLMQAIAVGDIGSIEGNTFARFCGVALERNTNTADDGERVASAVYVGMFDPATKPVPIRR